MSVLTKAARLFSRKKVEPLRHVVEYERVDEGVLSDWKTQAKALDREYDDSPVVNDAEGDASVLDHEVWGDMLDDAFYSYFGYDEPRVRDEAEIQSSRYVNRTLAEKLHRTDNFRETRPGTRNRPMESAIATMSAAKQLREEYQGALKEHADRASDMADAERQLADLDDLMEAMRKRGAETDSADVDLFRELGRKKRELRDELAQIQNAQGAAAVAINGAVQQAAERVAGVVQSSVAQVDKIPGVGVGKGAGQPANISPDAMFELAERYRTNDQLRRVMEMVGGLVPDMRFMRRTQRKGGIEEMVDIETGNQIPNLLPGELVRLMHPIAKLDFYRRFHEEQLLQYEYTSTEDLGAGPLIFVIDESFSMGGAKIVWAKALCVAGLSIAHRENRNSAVVCFGSPGQQRSFVFPKGRPVDPVVIADMAEHFFAGGTSTLTGLKTAGEIMRDNAPFHHADIVIVTDGQDTWTDEDDALHAELQGMGVRFHGISIGIAPTNYLMGWCDHAISAHDLQGKNEATDRVATRT